MKTLIYFTNLVSICMNTWINTLFYIKLFLVCVISSLIWISSLILCTTSLYALAGPKIGQIKSCILYLVSCIVINPKLELNCLDLHTLLRFSATKKTPEQRYILYINLVES